MNFWEFILFLGIGSVVIVGKKQSDQISYAFPDFFYEISHNPRIKDLIDVINNYEVNEYKDNKYLCKFHSKKYIHPEDKNIFESISNDNFNYLLNDFNIDELDRRNEHELALLQNEIKMKNEKRSGGTGTGCDCKIKNDIIDLGYTHFPRYLFNAVCQSTYDDKLSHMKRCWRGSSCKPVEYKVRVLTYRTGQTNPTGLLQKDHASLLPESLRSEWKFKTITVAAGCFCSH